MFRFFREDFLKSFLFIDDSVGVIQEYTIKRIIPIVIAESAMLNAGQKPTSIKSITKPYNTRSNKLPIAPPRTRPKAKTKNRLFDF